jgi:hypothetical protein
MQVFGLGIFESGSWPGYAKRSVRQSTILFANLGARTRRFIRALGS